MPLRVEDADGKVQWQAPAIEPYGDLGAAQQAAPLRLRFAGHFYDEHLDLHFNRFRDYDPKLGRYLQRDPLGHAAGNNLYAYCPNPAVDVDLRGLVHRRKKATEEEAKVVGPLKPLAEGDKETLHLPDGLRKVTTGDEDGGFTVRHFDGRKELAVHKFNEHGQLVHAEMVMAPKKSQEPYEKGSSHSRPTPEDMRPTDHRGHVGPEAHAADQRVANRPENVLAENEKSNTGPKKRFENDAGKTAKQNPDSEIRTTHDYEYPNDDTTRPSSSSHGIMKDGEPMPEKNTGPIPNDASAKNTVLESEK